VEQSLPAVDAFLELLPVPALVVESGDRIVLANSRACTLLGWGAGGLSGRLLSALLGELEGRSVKAELLAGRERWSRRLTLRGKDGGEVPVEAVGAFVSGGARAILLLEEVKDGAGGQARLSEDRLQQAIRLSQIGIFDHDQVSGTVYWSPEQRANYGWGPDEVVTLDKFLAQVHPADLARIAAAVRHAHDPAGSGLFDVEHRIIRRDGKVRRLLTRSQTMFEGEGASRRPVRTVGAVLDVTEQRDAADALRIKDQAIATAFNGIAIADAEARIVYANPAFLRMWGYSSEAEVLGRMPQEFLADSTAAPRIIERVRADGFWQGELVARRRDGSTFDLVLSASAIATAGDEGPYLMGSFLDVTEQRRLEAQLRQAQKMESIGRLAGGVAHDFNNLLTAIKGYVELALLDVAAADPLRELLSEIHHSTDSAANLVRQLLTFSRKQIIDPRVINLNEVIGHLRPMLQRLLGEDVELRVAPLPDLGQTRMDRGQLEQILVNLAINARDAMPTGGKLTIETANVTLDAEYVREHPHAVPGRYVLLMVSDEGNGMSEEVKAHLFEPFFTTKDQGKGTGLGLPMVYGAVKQNRGSIEVYSEAGHGTSFKIYLPRLEAAPEPVPEPLPSHLPVGTETILLVEDEAQVRAMAERLLTRQGYTVRAFADGAEALEAVRARQSPLHLLITDVVLPGMNGRKLAREVEALCPGIRVLYASGYSENVVIHHGVLDSGIEFIAKPYSIELLAQRVREVLDRPR